MCLQKSLDGETMVGGECANSRQLLTIVQKAPWKASFTSEDRWLVVDLKILWKGQAGMCFVVSGYVLGAFILVPEDHVKYGIFIWPGRGFFKHLKSVSGTVKYGSAKALRKSLF